MAQAILGHSDLQTTLGYTHVLAGWQGEAMKRLEAVVLFPNVPKSEKESEERASELVGVPAIEVVRPERVELPTLWFVATRAIHLRHGRIVSFQERTKQRNSTTRHLWPPSGPPG